MSAMDAQGARILPSDVVEIIKQMFPRVHERGKTFKLDLEPERYTQLAAVVSMVEHIPQYLITLSPKDFAYFHASLAMVRTAVHKWGDRQAGSKEPKYINLPGIKGVHPLKRLYMLLKRCDDRAPMPQTPQLLFIEDDGFRETLRQDISEMEVTLNHNAWKAATLLAGSLVEAMLLNALQKVGEAEVRQALKGGSSAPKGPMNTWGLSHLSTAIQSLESQLLPKETLLLIDVAKAYRNLIHPGRAERLAVCCDRATAYAALAACHAVARDLGKAYCVDQSVDGEPT